MEQELSVSAAQTGPSQAEPEVSALRASVPDAGVRTNSQSYTDGLRDLSRMAHVPKSLQAVLRDSAKMIDKAEAENGNLRIGFWNMLRKMGVHQDLAIKIICEAAQGVAAGTDETANAGSAEGKSPVATPCANTSQVTVLSGDKT